MKSGVSGLKMLRALCAPPKHLLIHLTFLFTLVSPPIEWEVPRGWDLVSGSFLPINICLTLGLVQTRGVSIKVC